MEILTAYLKKRVIDGAGRQSDVREGSGVGKSRVVGSVKLRSAQATLQGLISSSGTTARWIERVTPPQLADATFPFVPISHPAEFGIVANNGAPIDVDALRSGVEGDEAAKNRAVLSFFLSQFGTPESEEAYRTAARSVSFVRNVNRELGPASVVGRPVQAPYYRTCEIDGQRYHAALAVCSIPCFVGCFPRKNSEGEDMPTGMTFEIGTSDGMNGDVAYALNRDASEARRFTELFAVVRCVQVVDLVVSDTILGSPRTFALPITRSAEANPYWFEDVISARCIETPYADTERAGRLRSSMDNYLAEKIIENMCRRVGDDLYYISAADLDDLGVFDAATGVSVSRIYELYRDGVDQTIRHFAEYGYADEGVARLALEQQIRWLVNRIREYKAYVNRSPFLDHQGQKLSGRMVTGTYPGGIPIDAKTFSRYWHGDHILETLARFVFSGSSAAGSGGADVDFYQTTDELSSEFDGLEDYVERGLKDPVFAGSLTGIMGGRVGHAIVGRSGSRLDGDPETGYLMPFLTTTSRATERDIEHLFIGLLRMNDEDGKPVFFSYLLTAPGRCSLTGAKRRSLFLFKYVDTAPSSGKYGFGHRFVPWCVISGKELTQDWIVLQPGALFLGTFKEGTAVKVGEHIKVQTDYEVLTDSRAVSVNHAPSRHETFSSKVTLALIETKHANQVTEVASLVNMAVAEQEAFETKQNDDEMRLVKERVTTLNAKFGHSRPAAEGGPEAPVDPKPTNPVPSPAAPGAVSSEERAARSMGESQLDVDVLVADDDDALNALAASAKTDAEMNAASGKAKKASARSVADGAEKNGDKKRKQKTKAQKTEEQAAQPTSVHAAH